MFSVAHNTFTCLSEANVNTQCNVALRVYIPSVDIKIFRQHKIYYSDFVLVFTEHTYESEKHNPFRKKFKFQTVSKLCKNIDSISKIVQSWKKK